MPEDALSHKHTRLDRDVKMRAYLIRPCNIENWVKLRAARVSGGMDQTALGKALGVTFQQVQKYESGRDRVAAGTLQKLDEVLGIHPGDFFDETTAPVGSVAELREAMSMAVAVQKITSPPVRKRMIALIEELAGQDMAELDAPT